MPNDEADAGRPALEVTSSKPRPEGAEPEPTLGVLLARARREVRHTHESMAQAINSGATIIERWESGYRVSAPDRHELIRFFQGFDPGNDSVIPRLLEELGREVPSGPKAPKTRRPPLLGTATPRERSMLQPVTRSSASSPTHSRPPPTPASIGSNPGKPPAATMSGSALASQQRPSTFLGNDCGHFSSAVVKLKSQIDELLKAGPLAEDDAQSKWPYEDRVLAWLHPSYAASIGAYHKGLGGGWRSVVGLSSSADTTGLDRGLVQKLVDRVVRQRAEATQNAQSQTEPRPPTVPELHSEERSASNRMRTLTVQVPEETWRVFTAAHANLQEKEILELTSSLLTGALATATENARAHGAARGGAQGIRHGTNVAAGAFRSEPNLGVASATRATPALLPSRQPAAPGPPLGPRQQPNNSAEDLHRAGAGDDLLRAQERLQALTQSDPHWHRGKILGSLNLSPGAISPLYRLAREGLRAGSSFEKWPGQHRDVWGATSMLLFSRLLGLSDKMTWQSIGHYLGEPKIDQLLTKHHRQALIHGAKQTFGVEPSTTPSGYPRLLATIVHQSGGNCVVLSELAKRVTREKGWLSLLHGAPSEARRRIEDYCASRTVPLPPSVRTALADPWARESMGTRLKNLAEARQEIEARTWLRATAEETKKAVSAEGTAVHQLLGTTSEAQTDLLLQAIFDFGRPTSVAPRFELRLEVVSGNRARLVAHLPKTLRIEGAPESSTRARLAITDHAVAERPFYVRQGDQFVYESGPTAFTYPHQASIPIEIVAEVRTADGFVVHSLGMLSYPDGQAAVFSRDDGRLVQSWPADTPTLLFFPPGTTVTPSNGLEPRELVSGPVGASVFEAQPSADAPKVDLTDEHGKRHTWRVRVSERTIVLRLQGREVPDLKVGRWPVFSSWPRLWATAPDREARYELYSGARLLSSGSVDTRHGSIPLEPREPGYGIFQVRAFSEEDSERQTFVVLPGLKASVDVTLAGAVAQISGPFPATLRRMDGPEHGEQQMALPPEICGRTTLAVILHLPDGATISASWRPIVHTPAARLVAAPGVPVESTDAGVLISSLTADARLELFGTPGTEVRLEGNFTSATKRIPESGFIALDFMILRHVLLGDRLDGACMDIVWPSGPATRIGPFIWEGDFAPHVAVSHTDPKTLELTPRVPIGPGPIQLHVFPAAEPWLPPVILPTSRPRIEEGSSSTHAPLRAVIPDDPKYHDGLQHLALMQNDRRLSAVATLPFDPAQDDGDDGAGVAELLQTLPATERNIRLDALLRNLAVYGTRWLPRAYRVEPLVGARRFKAFVEGREDDPAIAVLASIGCPLAATRYGDVLTWAASASTLPIAELRSALARADGARAGLAFPVFDALTKAGVPASELLEARDELSMLLDEVAGPLRPLDHGAIELLRRPPPTHGDVVPLRLRALLAARLKDTRLSEVLGLRPVPPTRRPERALELPPTPEADVVVAHISNPKLPILEAIERAVARWAWLIHGWRREGVAAGPLWSAVEELSDGAPLLFDYWLNRIAALSQAAHGSLQPRGETREALMEGNLEMTKPVSQVRIENGSQFLLSKLRALEPGLERAPCGKCGGPQTLEVGADGIALVCSSKPCRARQRVGISVLQRLADAARVSCYHCHGTQLLSETRPYANILVCAAPPCGSKNQWPNVAERLRGQVVEV